MTTATLDTRPASSSKLLHYGLWAAQALLAAAFLMAGSAKSTKPLADLATMMPWTAAVPVGLVRFIGVSELLGGLGLLLPALTRIKPWLTPLAAAGLATIMALAIPFHLSRGEPQALVFNLTLGGLAAFIAWGRFKKSPIAPRA